MPSLGRFGRDLAYGDQPLTDGTLTLMIRTPPRVAWSPRRGFLEHVAANINITQSAGLHCLQYNIHIGASGIQNPNPMTWISPKP
jgi:hypothetical protein